MKTTFTFVFRVHLGYSSTTHGAIEWTNPKYLKPNSNKLQISSKVQCKSCLNSLPYSISHLEKKAITLAFGVRL